MECSSQNARKLPLTLWFWAANLVATHSDGMSLQEFGALLRVTHQTARLLKQKFRRSMNNEPLEGRVEVGHSDIPFRGADSFLDLAKSRKIIVAAAMSSLEIRLAAIPDDSAASIEAF